MALSIYLAGPDVFLPNAVEVGKRKQELCRHFGFEGLFPLDQDEAAEADAAAIFRANCSLMRRADIGLFNLTPFRGPSADAGTVFELGFLFAQGKPVYGYSSTSANYTDRVRAECGPLVVRDGRPWDRDGREVETFGLSDNLMIVQAIQEAGGTITAVEQSTPVRGAVQQEQGDSDEGLAAFEAFEECLKRVRDDVQSGRLSRSRE